MKKCPVSIYRDLRAGSKWTVRATCFALAFAVGLVCLWSLECNCGILLALLSSVGFGYAGCFRWFADTEVAGPKDTEVVLVTGCDSGLGYSLALHLRSLGLRVIAGVHREASPGAVQLSTISGIFVRPVDIASCESVKTFRDAVRDYLKRESLVLRALVNNAGSMIFGEFEWQTEQQARHQVEVNLLGTMRVTREFLPLVRRHLTRLIVVTSHCASEPLPGVAIYGATKAALSAWATSLRVELGKYGVDVVSFVPGSFIGESNLLSRQLRHFEAMESAMSEETRLFYGDYFTRYASYLSGLEPTQVPKKLMNPTVYKVFEGALLDRYPRAVYKCEPWRYMIYHLLFKISPTSLRDQLVERFVQLPAWKETDRRTNDEKEKKERQLSVDSAVDGEE